MGIVSLGAPEAGNKLNIVTYFTAPAYPEGERTLQSTAVTFDWIRPDGLLEVQSNPATEISGPTYDTVVEDGITLTRTRWIWRTPTLTQVGQYAIRSTSSAGITAAHQVVVTVPNFAPFDTALPAPTPIDGFIPAAQVSVADTAGKFTGTNVESVLDEITPLITSASASAVAARFSGSFTATCRGMDAINGDIWLNDVTNGSLKQSSDEGSTISNGKGIPAGVTTTSTGGMVRFGSFVYMLAIDSGDSTLKIWRTAPQTGNNAFSWGSPLQSFTALATSLMTSISTDQTYIYVCEYGDPTGGPSAWRSPDGTTWTRMYGPNAAARHIHAVQPDPYNAGHIWMTLGDGIATTIVKSIDYGANWSTVVASSTWQGVQISFDPNWVWVAGDSQQGTVFVIDRATGTPRHATPTWHYNIAVPGAATVTDRYYANAYYGAVDPATGVYYCVAMDTSAPGTMQGWFALIRAGAHLEIFDRGVINTSMNSRVFITTNYVITGQWRKRRWLID